MFKRLAIITVVCTLYYVEGLWRADGNDLRISGQSTHITGPLSISGESVDSTFFASMQELQESLNIYDIYTINNFLRQKITMQLCQRSFAVSLNGEKYLVVIAENIVGLYFLNTTLSLLETPIAVPFRRAVDYIRLNGSDHLIGGTEDSSISISRWDNGQLIPTGISIPTEQSGNLRSIKTFENFEKTYVAVGYSTSSERISNKVYRIDGNSFVEVLSFNGQRVVDIEPFTISGTTYVAFSDLFNVSIYRMINSDSLVLHQFITGEVEGEWIPENIKYFEIQQSRFLAIGSETQPKVFIWSSSQNLFEDFNIEIPEDSSIFDWEYFNYGGSSFLLASFSTNNVFGFLEASSIYRWNGSSMNLIGKVKSVGAVDSTAFYAGEHMYIFICNAQQSNNLNIESFLYRL